MQQEIYYAIENLHGIDIGLYPPLMAFEAIVRMQISQLEKPIVLCVDLVIEELSNAVRNCTKRVSVELMIEKLFFFFIEINIVPFFLDIELSNFSR